MEQLKHFLLAVSCCIIAMMGIIFQSNVNLDGSSSDVSLTNLTAYSDAENGGSTGNTDEEKSDSSLTDWWNRKDYICVSVTCRSIWSQYKSKVSQKVENGKGTEAHSWNCPGCADGYGWTVD